MTEHTPEIERIEASELFAPASGLPETNFKARTLAQKLVAATTADSDRNRDHLNGENAAAFGRNKELHVAEITESNR